MLAKRLVVAVLMLGLATVGTSIGFILHDRNRLSVPSFGQPSAAQPSTAASTPTIRPTPRSKGRPVRVDRSGPPVRISLPALNIRADVQVVSTDGAALQVPADPALVGWWVGSAPVGAATGTAVLVGHVDSARLGIGALFQIGRGRLRSGATVTVTTAAGGSFEYRVYAQRIYRKAIGIPADVFDAGGSPRLVLITCGGPFDETTKSYEDNVIAFASPS